MNSAAITSPCIGVCRMDPNTALCTGCARTLDEIAAWSKLSPAERSAVLAELPHRSAPCAATAPPPTSRQR
ncbi:MAG: DUF1289 domain-containing protein [Ideonella sp.]|nr:DUF1289 domain-containing protein [Ideonella sp.]